MASKRKGIWNRADIFAAKHAINAQLKGPVHEYLRFAFMQGYMARQRDERRAAQRRGEDR